MTWHSNISVTKGKCERKTLHQALTCLTLIVRVSWYTGTCIHVNLIHTGASILTGARSTLVNVWSVKTVGTHRKPHNCHD